MNREVIVADVLKAYTLSECLNAERQLSDWLQMHPHDIGLHELAGGLAIVKSAAIERENNAIRTPAASMPLVPVG